MSENAWIEHKGNACPVPSGSTVDVTLRDGEVLHAQHLNCLDWRTEPMSRFDIIAYRLSGPSA